jgi:hypothetical protein
MLVQTEFHNSPEISTISGDPSAIHILMRRAGFPVRSNLEEYRGIAFTRVSPA